MTLYAYTARAINGELTMGGSAAYARVFMMVDGVTATSFYVDALPGEKQQELVPDEDLEVTGWA